MGEAGEPAGENQKVRIETLNQVPDDYDPRLTIVLREAMPNDVLVRFYSMAIDETPEGNYRWDLYSDGRLFVAYHSGKKESLEIPFDQPLPKKPAKILTADEIRALYEQLDQTAFFSQPVLQRVIPQEGGVYTIVRARRGDTVHDVVYEKVQNSLIEFLNSIVI